MLINFLSSLLTGILLLLGSVHFYWSFGGKWGTSHVIPIRTNEVTPIHIPKVAAFFVGLILYLFSVLYFTNIIRLNIYCIDYVKSFTLWFIPSLFILRSIGDFRYVGFFKKNKHTRFAQADTKWFTPLCLLMSILGILVQCLLEFD